MKKALWNGMFSGAFFAVLILVVWEREILRFQSDCAGRNRMLFVHEQNSVWQIAAGIQDECRCVSQQPDRSLTAWIFKCACSCQPGIRRLWIVRYKRFQQKTVIVSPAGLKLLKAYRIRRGLDGRAQASLFSKIKRRLTSSPS